MPDLIKISELSEHTTPVSNDVLAIVDTNTGVTKKIKVQTLVDVSSPAGVMQPYGGTTAPDGWLLCNGAAVSRATYSRLFTAIGTAWGAGDGSTTFNLPDMRGRSFFGYDASQTDFNAVGKTGGNKTANLAHSHTVNSHAHGGSAATSGNTNANHSHGGIVRGGSFSDGQTPDHTHNYTVTNQASSPGTNSQLSSSTSVLAPYAVGNVIIKV